MMDLKERAAGIPRHPWELARIKMLHQIFSRFATGKNAFRILDVGCGDGFVLGSLAQRKDIVQAHGLDINLLPDDIAMMATSTVQFFNDPAQLTAKYDVILLCDVLEHVENDVEFLSRIVEKFAAPGAVFIITVPAYQMLFSSHDIFLDHHRRYSFSLFRTVINKSGLAILGQGSFFLSLLLLRGIQCLKEKAFGRPKSALLSQGGGALTGFFVGVLSGENRFLLALCNIGIRLPGLTLWAVGRR